MKTHLFCAVVLLLASASAFAGEGDADQAVLPFKKSFSLELGTGIQPLHATLTPYRSEKVSYADKGQRLSRHTDFYPNLSVSEVWRPWPHWEFCLTESFTCAIVDVQQYGTFGVDPNGKPRYDLNVVESSRIQPSIPIMAVTFQTRIIWSPYWRVTMYSALGFGFTTATEFYPLPEITPVAARFGSESLYFFAEATIGPIATFAHGGLGWRF